MRPVLCEDFSAVVIFFYLSYTFHSGPFQAQGKAADAGA
jgi:hypothetical protein